MMRTASARRAVAAAVLGVLPLVLAATACSGGTASSTPGSGLEKTNLIVDAVPAETGAALYIAQERGIFAAHGLHVTINSIRSSSVIVPAMLHGSIDIASGQLTSFIAAQATGVGHFRVLAIGLDLGPGVNQILTSRSSGIADAAQLKGKTIAVNAPVGDAPLLTDSVLAGYGIKPGQVTLKVLPFPAMGAALAAHRVDAVYSTEPYITEMEQKYGDTVVADTDQGAAAGLPTAGYTATTAWMKKYPKTAAAFAASIAEAARVADTNLMALQHAFIVSLHLSPQVADVMATGDFPIGVNSVKLQQVANLMFRFGELKARFDTDALTG
jgi:NitT/TauT family transport system substrate-binding protein